MLRKDPYAALRYKEFNIFLLLRFVNYFPLDLPTFIVNERLKYSVDFLFLMPLKNIDILSKSQTNYIGLCHCI